MVGMPGPRPLVLARIPRSLASHAATAPSWTPTGGRAIAVCGPHATTGKYYLEARYDLCSSSKSKDPLWPSRLCTHAGAVTLTAAHQMSWTWDFAHEKTALTRLVESRGHILRMCVLRGIRSWLG